MPAKITNAVIPKAKGMYAKRLSVPEYEELMGRRTVPEVAAVLKRHPYFRDSLATLSPTDPHRAQIEELLDMDIYNKYRSLAHYDPERDGFSAYYMMEIEIRQILKVLQLLSIGIRGGYFSMIPAYMVNHTRIDLFALAKANSFAEVLAVLEHTPYYRPLKELLAEDPALRRFPFVECAMLQFWYKTIFELIDIHFSGPEKTAVQSLFLLQAEAYNLEMIFRVKTFFPRVYTPEEIRRLMLPYHIHVPAPLWQPIVEAPDGDALLAIYRKAGVVKTDGPLAVDAMVTTGGRMVHAYAQHLLHLTSSPAAALAAFLALAEFERENVVNVIEGVRYSLPPEKIRSMLLL